MNNKLEIHAVDWDDQRDALKTIRKSVFIDEQHVPEDLEWDDLDKTSIHFLATIDSLPIATARLTPQGQVGRMAVLKEYRGNGTGTQLLARVIEHAKRIGYKQLFLHAQVNVISFYERHGFNVESDVFIEAGIEHQSMKMLL
jgi:predicted GNAT family N-acyltransferase